MTFEHMAAWELRPIVESLTEDNTALRARVAELEGQHKGLVLNNAMLRQRPDLPADRIPAAQAYEKRIAELEAALKPFAETTDFRALPLTCTQSDLRRARAALGDKPTSTAD
jgi:uncharacterized protein (DUF3084 family)